MKDLYCPYLAHTSKRVGYLACQPTTSTLGSLLSMLKNPCQGVLSLLPESGSKTVANKVVDSSRLKYAMKATAKPIEQNNPNANYFDRR